MGANKAGIAEPDYDRILRANAEHVFTNAMATRGVYAFLNPAG